MKLYKIILILLIMINVSLAIFTFIKPDHSATPEIIKFSIIGLGVLIILGSLYAMKAKKNL